jgi:hypothetical protein
MADVNKSLLSILNWLQEKPVEVTRGTPLLLFLFQEVGHDGIAAIH